MIDVTTFSDKIPQEFIKPQEFWHGRSHSVNIKPILGHHQVPNTHRDRVCPGGNHNGVGNKGIPCCGSCRGAFFWFTHYCRGCGIFFIRDFYHPAYCDYYPCCWNCLPELPWSHCPDHAFSASHFYDLLIPPLGLNPKTFTREELLQAGVNVFSFD